MRKCKILALVMACVLIVSTVSACSIPSVSSGSTELKKIMMVTDVGGVNDMSFNQSAWRGLQEYHEMHPEIEVGYIESAQESDYESNFDIAADSGANLIFGIGYNLTDAISNAAKLEPDVSFVLMDGTPEEENERENLSGVMFRAQEGAFIVGYIAALTSESKKVGFVGGQEGYIIGQFQYGFQAGVAYAAKELGVDVQCFVQYTESFADAAKGKSVANKMIGQGADVIYHAAGGCGVGAIQAAADAGKWAIGCDSDQSYLAPNTVITSSIKDIGKAAIKISDMRLEQGLGIGGKNYDFGVKEGIVGIPERSDILSESVYNKAIKLESKISDGTIVPPETEQKYNEFLKTIDD